MAPSSFTGLCKNLVRDGGLRPTLQVTIEEQVAKTLYLLAHNVTNRELSFIFRRSGESDCISAIDGTHIRVKVSQHEAPKFCVRKDYPTQNVLAACTFDLKFTYVLAGGEGKFYLVDAGLMLESRLITPYRGEQYHLKEYSRNNPPRNSRELFNLRHSSFRNARERAFGFLKQKFPIISSSTKSSYGIETQKLIKFACCILHNYLRGVESNDKLLAQVDAELMNDDNTVHEEPPNSRESNEEFRKGELIRDGIATAMWDNYQD
ncbi:hypothetical protein P3L10_026349 [Capsicum annuum]|uniref:uncharacterized protein LOC124890806 n=1 Tax=Capsicum annuum TaxID=4072 RepID=UPI001FB140A3|nr:uncharacterized protein LOC124890806 [Capsicum annuum]